MKVIVAGGRDFDNYDYLCETLNNLDFIISEIVCGCASGADSLGERYAKENGISVKYFPANWGILGKHAGPIRNLEMAQYGDYLVAFWDGKSAGTKNMIDSMKHFKKHGIVKMYERKK